MAVLRERMTRKSKVVWAGPVVCNPAVGALETPPHVNYSGDISIEIGDRERFSLVLEREELFALSNRLRQVVAMIRASEMIRPEPTDEELEDLFSEAMSDIHDMDTGITNFARACVSALRGAG